MKTTCCALLFAATLLHAASFEVATIKPARPDEAGYSGEDGRNGVLKMWNVSVKRCISYAYRIPEGQILGGPKWIDELGYDILAKADQPRSVDRVGVDANGNGGAGRDGCRIEWVANIAHGQPGLLFGRHRLYLRAVEEARIPVGQRDVFDDGQFSGESGIEALGLLIVRSGGG